MPLAPHKKSRLGCDRCKQRRVKCDQNSPCGNCVRRREVCSFFQICHNITPCSAVNSCSEKWRIDLYLMHHYSLHTSLTLSEDQNVRRFWQNWVPSESMRHSFLMHQLLALAASHLAHLRPSESESLIGMSKTHQATALRMFRHSLPSVINQDCSVAFAVASLIPVQAQATMLQGMPAEAIEHGGLRCIMPLESIAQLMVLVRGMRDLFTPDWGSITQGPAQAVFGQVFQENSTVTLPLLLKVQVEKLRNGLYNFAQGHPQADVLPSIEALDLLEGCIRDLTPCLNNNRPLEMGLVWKWVALIPAEYMTSVQAYHAPALIVLAYFAAVSVLWSHRWYIGSWSYHCIYAIQQEVDPAWSEFLEWPLSQTQESMMALFKL